MKTGKEITEYLFKVSFPGLCNKTEHYNKIGFKGINRKQAHYSVKCFLPHGIKFDLLDIYEKINHKWKKLEI
jgi:hypothetical protein